MADWGYQREDRQTDALKGRYRCVIVDVDEAISKTSGLPMIVVSVRPSGTKFKVKTYIVKNDRFNRTMTQFFDAFPEIPDGNFNFVEWIGAEGAAEFGEDESGYTKLKWFISANKAEGLPPFEGEKPERQTITAIDDAEEEPDDLPWI